MVYEFTLIPKNLDFYFHFLNFWSYVRSQNKGFIFHITFSSDIIIFLKRHLATGFSKLCNYYHFAAQKRLFVSWLTNKKKKRYKI